jgi:hypothetical protein
MYLYFDYLNSTGDGAIPLSGGSSGDSISEESRSTRGEGNFLNHSNIIIVLFIHLFIY